MTHVVFCCCSPHGDFSVPCLANNDKVIADVMFKRLLPKQYQIVFFWLHLYVYIKRHNATRTSKCSLKVIDRIHLKIDC